MPDPPASPYTLFPLPEFLTLEMEDRENLLEPWLRAQGLALVHAWRGVGKTFFGLSVAYAVASGTSFGKWKAPATHPVVYLDGEMSAVELQERLRELVKMHGVPPPPGLSIFTPDFQTGGILNLSSRFDHPKLAPHLAGASLIVVDNISTLCRGGDENEAKEWEVAQEWALGQRKHGRAVLFVHHDSKSGSQRGSSKREDVLDTVIHLKHPSDYEADQGARFEVHFTKARGLHGKDVEPFQMALESTQGGLRWSVGPLEVPLGIQAQELMDSGLTQAQAAARLGVDRTTIYRAIRKLENQTKD